MGTFMGHVIPGTFFVIFGIWWAIRISLRYYSAKFSSGHVKYTSTATFTIATRWGELQIEGYIKVLFCSIGIIGEMVTAFNQGQFQYMGNGQHATMFFFFGFSGVVDILLHHRVLLPTNSDYIMLFLAVFVEGLLFKFHLHGREDLDVQIHILLVYVVFLSCVIILAEMSWPHNVLISFGRSFLTLLQGTWFIQLAFILYNPLPNPAQWNGEDHMQIMLTTIIFAWHMMAIFVFILLTAIVTGCVFRRRRGRGFGGVLSGGGDDDLALERLIGDKSPNGHHSLIPLTQDTDSDLDFEASVNSVVKS